MQNKIKKIKKGTFVKIVYRGDIKGVNGEKITQIVGRMGIIYNNTQAYKNKPQNEEKTPRKYVDEIVVPNLLFKSKDGRLKVRIYTSNNINHRAKSKYYVDGMEVSKQELLEQGVIKPSKPRECICFEVFLDNIISIG